MNDVRRVDPLHGVTLKEMVEHLAERCGWDGLDARIDIRCFTHDPSVGSSLEFLRKDAVGVRQGGVAVPPLGGAPAKGLCGALV